MWQKLHGYFSKSAQAAQAKIQNGALVFYAPQAQMPTIWRVSLEELASAQFSVMAQGAGFVLVYQMLDEKPHIVAQFATLAQAQAGLEAILSALFAGTNTWGVKLPWKPLIKWGVVLFVLYVVWSVFSALLGAFGDAETVQNQTTATPAAQIAPQKTDTLKLGEPVDADAVLQGLGE